MEQEQNPIQHLESARQLIREEQGSIQIVGRTLTPDEERRLDALMAAEININDAIGHLTASDTSETIPILADGR
jgi:hypothetical protein